MKNVVGVHRTAGGNAVVRFRVSHGSVVNHCYVVANPRTGDCVFVDPAWEPEVLHGYVEQENLNPCGVLVTHHHFDHVHLADTLSQHYRCPVLLSEIEHNYYRLLFHDMVIISHQSELHLGELSVVPLLTPGHTAGGLCYRIDDALFTGDTLFNEGCGACGDDGSNAIQLFFSLQRLLRDVAPTTRVYPGHRFHTDLGRSLDELKRINIYLQFDRVDAFVRFRMRADQRQNMAFL